MKILQTYGGTEWCADPCAVLVDPGYYDEYQREADAIFKEHPNIDKVRFRYVGGRVPLPGHDRGLRHARDRGR